MYSLSTMLMNSYYLKMTNFFKGLYDINSIIKEYECICVDVFVTLNALYEPSVYFYVKFKIGSTVLCYMTYSTSYDHFCPTWNERNLICMCVYKAFLL
jgi:hypothetical protein